MEAFFHFKLLCTSDDSVEDLEPELEGGGGKIRNKKFATSLASYFLAILMLLFCNLFLIKILTF